MMVVIRRRFNIRPARLLLCLCNLALLLMWYGNINLHHDATNELFVPSIGVQSATAAATATGVVNHDHQKENRNLTRYKTSTMPQLTHHTCSILNRTETIPQVPHFIIAGAQKSGTTALFEFLKLHPNIQSSKSLETHFFDWHYPSAVQKNDWLLQHNLSLTISDSEFSCAILRAYSEQFDVSGGETALNSMFFEKTPSYLFLTKVPELISMTCFWKPKIIVLLRNPIDRAFSHFRMQLRTFGRSFEDLIDEEVKHLKGIGLSYAPPRDSFDPNDSGFAIPHLSITQSEALHWKHYRRMFSNNYLQRGMYVIQLRHWMKFFPLGESLMVVNYERFRTHPEEIYSKLLDFVGATPYHPGSGFDIEHNAHGPAQQPMLPNTRKYLAALFRPYNDMLADTLGEEWRDVWD